MKFESKRFDELTEEELYEILKSRNEIFVIEQMGADRIFIEAEDYVEGYYTMSGFVRTSDVFLKDDIPHVHMELWK